MRSLRGMTQLIPEFLNEVFALEIDKLHFYRDVENARFECLREIWVVGKADCIFFCRYYHAARFVAEFVISRCDEVEVVVLEAMVVAEMNHFHLGFETAQIAYKWPWVGDTGYAEYRVCLGQLCHVGDVCRKFGKHRLHIPIGILREEQVLRWIEVEPILYKAEVERIHLGAFGYNHHCGTAKRVE